MKSPRRHRSAKRSRWAWNNSPDGLRNRRAKADARREALAETLPPIPNDPAPGTVWQTVQVLDACGGVMHSITLYVPTAGRCDQHAATIDSKRCERVQTATDIGRHVAGWISKRPSLAERAEWR